MKIPLTKPFIDQSDFHAVQIPLESGWLVQGPQVALFEQAVAKFCGLPHAVATSSCTSALHLCMIVASIGPGDRVMIPAFTYVATANAVEYVGAEPVFIDIDPVTMNICPQQIRDSLERFKDRKEPFPKAIVPVHLFGLCADIPRILNIIGEYGLTVIEDAACALGSTVNGQSPGQFGLAACFSFHPRKVITTGEGGMVVTMDESVAHQLRILRDHGAEVTDHRRHVSQKNELPEFNRLGYNYRMTDILAALGYSQMEKVTDILRERRRLAANYHELLKRISWLRTSTEPDGFIHTYQSYICCLEIPNGSPKKLGKIRGKLIDHMAHAGVSTRPGTHAVHCLGYYSRKYDLTPDQYPNAWHAHNSTITLPLYPGLLSAHQEYIVDTLERFAF